MSTGNVNISGYVCAKCGAWVSTYDIHYCFKDIPTPIQPYHTEHCYCRPCDHDGIDKTEDGDHLKCCMCGVRRKKENPNYGEGMK